VLIAPGRTALEEAFDYDQLEFSIDLRSSGKLVVRE
jgi:urease accessory protein UreH